MWNPNLARYLSQLVHPIWEHAYAFQPSGHLEVVYYLVKWNQLIFASQSFGLNS